MVVQCGGANADATGMACQARTVNGHVLRRAGFTPGDMTQIMRRAAEQFAARGGGGAKAERTAGRKAEEKAEEKAEGGGCVEWWDIGREDVDPRGALLGRTS